MATPLNENQVRLILIVPKDLKRQFQIQCIRNDKDMTQRVIELMTEDVKSSGTK